MEVLLHLLCGGINLSFTGLNTKHGVSPHFTGLKGIDWTKNQPSTMVFSLLCLHDWAAKVFFFFFFTCCSARQGLWEFSAPKWVIYWKGLKGLPSHLLPQEMFARNQGCIAGKAWEEKESQLIDGQQFCRFEDAGCQHTKVLSSWGICWVTSQVPRLTTDQALSVVPCVLFFSFRQILLRCLIDNQSFHFLGPSALYTAI